MDTCAAFYGFRSGSEQPWFFKRRTGYLWVLCTYFTLDQFYTQCDIKITVHNGNRSVVITPEELIKEYTMKKISLYFLSLIMLTGISCKKFIDVNTNPNVP